MREKVSEYISNFRKGFRNGLEDDFKLGERVAITIFGAALSAGAGGLAGGIGDLVPYVSHAVPEGLSGLGALVSGTSGCPYWLTLY